MTGVIYDIDGRVYLTPNNIFEWGDLVAVNEEGHPTDPYRRNGTPRIIEPNKPDGFHVYAGSARDQVFRVTDEPLTYSRRSVFTITSVPVDGHEPLDAAEAGVTHEAPAPVLTEVAATGGGYASGTRQVAFSLVDAGGRHTMLTAKTPHTVAVTGDSILLTLYNSYPVGVTGLGIWLSKSGQTTVYLQKIVDLSESQPATKDLTGPFRVLDYEPTTNKTFLGRTARPDAWITPSNFDLDGGTYELYATLSTLSGESLPNLTARTKTPASRVRSALKVAPSAKPRGLAGWFCYVRLSDGKTYRVFPAGSTPERPLLINQVAEVYSTDPGRWPSTWSVAQKDMPVADTSGIPNPDIAPYSISGIPTPTLVSGQTIYVQVALTEGDREGPRGPASQITISAANRMIKGKLSKTVQKIPNPEGVETDSSALPLEYTVRQTPTVNGSYSQPDPGVHQLVTSGTTALETVSVALQPNVLDKTATHTFLADMEVYNYSAGTAEIALLEYSTATPVYKVTTPTRETVIQSMTADGETEIAYSIPPAFWLAGTLSCHIVYRFSGASKNLGMRVRNAALFDHAVSDVRKWIDPLRGTAQPADPNANPADPFPEGATARIGPPRRTRIPPVGAAWGSINRPLTTGVVEKYYDFESGISGALTQYRTPTSGTTLTTNATASISSGSSGLFIEDLNTTTLSQIGVAETLTTGNRTRGSVSAEIRSPAATTSGARDYLYLERADATAFAALSQDQNRNLILWYKHAGVWFSRVIYVAVPNNTVMDVDLQVSGAGTNRGVIALWAAQGVGQTKTLRAFYEDIDLTDYPFQRYFAGALEYVASDTHQTHIDNLRVWDGGHKWYRVHNSAGEFLNQAHLFLPRDENPTQNAFLKDIRVAVKPGQRYALGTFFKYEGVRGTSYPLHVTLHKQNGDTIPLGSLVGGGGGIIGSAAWAEYTMEINVPSSATDEGENCYEMRINSRDIYGGTYTAQEVAKTEIGPLAPVAVNRTKGRASAGIYRVTLDTTTPKASTYVGSLPREWLKVGVDAEDEPLGTTIAVRLRSAPAKDGPYSAYYTSLIDVPRDRFLQVEVTFAGDGLETPILTDVAPYLDFAFEDSVLLKGNGSELSGGAVVTEYQIWYPDPQYELRRDYSGHYESIPLSDDVNWLDYFTVQFFTKEGLTYFRNRWAKELFTIESMGELVKIRLLEWPEVIPEGQATRLSADGTYYEVYATCEAGMSEVKEVTSLPEKEE